MGKGRGGKNSMSEKKKEKDYRYIDDQRGREIMRGKGGCEAREVVIG